MTPEDMKTVGLKDMSPMQLEALTKLIGHAIILSEHCGDADIAEDVLADANELIELLGGNGVSIHREVHLHL